MIANAYNQNGVSVENNPPKTLKLYVEEAKRIVDIFQGREGVNNSKVLYTLVKDGPQSAYDLGRPSWVSTMQRRLSELRKKGYVERREETSAKGGQKYMYWPTPKGLMAAAFLGLEDKELETAAFIYPIGEVVSKKFRIEMLEKKGRLKVGNRIAIHPHLIHLPYRIWLQLKYIQEHFHTDYLATTRGRELLEIWKQHIEVGDELDKWKFPIFFPPPNKDKDTPPNNEALPKKWKLI